MPENAIDALASENLLSVRGIFRALKVPFTSAFVASSDFALPSSMKNRESLGRSPVGGAQPSRHGGGFSITVVFVVHIYGSSITPWNALLIAASCSLVGAFDSGEYVTIAPMITYILIPLGLSPDACVAITLTIWLLFEWFPELQCIMAACANTAIVGSGGPPVPTQPVGQN